MANGTLYRNTIQAESARPSLTEVAQARPRRGKGAPSRCASHKSAILALLQERGPAGVLGSELYDSPEKFGRSPRNRISELRKEGCLISGEPRGSADWHYVLLRDNSGEEPQTNSSDWYIRQTGKPRPGWQSRPLSEKRMAQEDCFVLTPPEPRR
jgi:hypothetical protein